MSTEQTRSDRPESFYWLGTDPRSGIVTFDLEYARSHPGGYREESAADLFDDVIEDILKIDEARRA